MVGTSILVKQTTGIILSLVFVFYKILVAKGKEDWKNVAQIITVRLLGVLIPIILFLIYLLKNNITYEFLDYAIYGIKQFNNYMPYTNLLKYYGIHIAILAITIPVIILYMYYKAIIKGNNNLTFVLFAYSCASFIVVYPISDDVHFLFGAFPAILSLIYLLYDLLRKKIRIPKDILNYIIAIIIVYILIIAILNISTYIIECNQYNNIEHFKYIPRRL